ncbi:protein CFAP276-like isoform X2 [Argopecten irradians]|uniref:protein CFAP276-like isoform X2 n=1 Tax=Argopecten irradians TaxID=31199 RepID=UPI003718E93E
MERQMMSNRDPYSFPRNQNDDNFMGQLKAEIAGYQKPTHLAQNEDPWNRLNSTCTLASSRREIYHQDPVAPRDSLDFILKSQYNHHQAFLKDPNETLYQPETVGADHGRVLKNREKEVIKAKPYLNHPLSISSQKKKESIHSIENAIESPHSAGTNGGYSRKHDGGFYCT